MHAKMLANRYGVKIEKSNQEVYEDLGHYIGMRDSTPTLEQHMERLTTLDMSLNTSQP
jgi:hypothetical protein